LRAFVGLLLFSAVALTLHVQSARYRQSLAFAGGHILHGDLRPDTDAAAKILAQAAGSVPALLRWMVVLATAILLAKRADEFYDRRFPLSLLRYLARLFRAPPARPLHIVS
jgi:hypothetical protein